jgi:hypothetical protein
MAKKLKRALRKAAKVALPMLAVAGLGKAFMNNRNRRAMLEGADANEGFIDSMIPVRRGNKMMTPQDMANDPIFFNAMAAKGGRIMKTKRGGKAVRGFAKKKKQANKMRKK